jgi:hypothetical protein
MNHGLALKTGIVIVLPRPGTTTPPLIGASRHIERKASAGRAGSAATRRTASTCLVIAALAGVLVVLIVVSVGIGPVTLPATTTAGILWGHLAPGEHVATWTATQG